MNQRGIALTFKRPPESSQKYSGILKKINKQINKNFDQGFYLKKKQQELNYY